MADFSALLNQSTNDAMSTTVRALPEGEYIARIDEVKVESVPVKKGERAGQDVPVLRVIWDIIDDNLLRTMERQKATIRQDIWLDLDPLTGGLAAGEDKNVRLGQIRAALGFNNPGQQFSLSMLNGAGPCYIKVTQRSDEKDPEKKYNDVSRVVPLK